MAFHWDGATWTEVDPAGPGSLGDVDAVPSNDVWAVGGVGLGTLVERWNGSAWSVVPSPNLPAGGGYFSAVSALSSTDIWAVGSTIDGLLVHALIEHWDGSAWSIVPAPATGAELSLDAVTVVGPNDAWAVGFARQGQNYRPQILHWDGVAWAFSKLPKLPPNGTPGGGSGHLEHERVGGGERAERLRLLEDLDPSLDGLAWSRVRSPNPGGPSASNTLEDVTTLPTGETWAVGLDGLTVRYVP